MIPSEFVAPFLAFLGVVAGALIINLFGVWNRRRGAVENKLPSVQQIWDEQRKQGLELVDARAENRNTNRKLDKALKDNDSLSSAFTGMRDVFLRYVERVKSGGSVDLTPEEHFALELPVINDEEEDTITT